MPLSATMSLWGMYQYDDTILDNLTLPTGMDANNVKQNLLIETAGLTILYPDIDFLKIAIGVWSDERIDVWQKLYDTTLMTYDPIENYDRIEETEEQTNGVSVRDNEHNRNAAFSDVGVKDRNENRNTNASGQASEVNTQSGDSETVNANTAYNSNGFADTAKATSAGKSNSSTSNNSSSASSDSLSSDERESRNTESSERFNETGNESKSDNRRLKSRVHGNIGVKTASAMLVEARDEMQFCMTEFIVNDFINRFCVMVY